MPSFASTSLERRCSTARGYFAFPALFLAALLFQITLPQRAPWNKPPQEWNESEAFAILSDSPWSPVKPIFHLSVVEKSRNTATNEPISRSEAVARGELRRNITPRVAPGDPPSPSVLWWSAKTVRLAEQRLRQLKGQSPVNAALTAEELPEIVIVVEGSEPVRILRDPAGDLRETAFLELPSGMPLDPSHIEFPVMPDDAIERAAFHFPRAIDGRPTVTPNDPRVVFHCKVTAKTQLAGRPNQLSIRVEFDPRRMCASGRPDL